MTTPTMNWRATIAALLATGVLLLGACSDGDDDAKKDDDKSSESDDQNAADAGDNGDAANDGPIIDPDAPEADSEFAYFQRLRGIAGEFCKGAIEVVSMDVSADAAGTTDALEAAGALDPPDEIAAEWDKVISTALALQDVDPNDPAASQQAMEAYTDIEDENAKIVSYLQEQCGIDTGTPDPSTDTGSVTTGA